MDSHASAADAVASLRGRLAAREQQLAELIDEVNFAERGQASAEEALSTARAHAGLLADTVEDLLAYASELERECLLPAFGDLDAFLATSAARRPASELRAAALRRATEALKAVTGARRDELLAVLTQPLSDESIDLITATRLAALPPTQQAPVSLEDAVACAKLLLGRKDELKVLLFDARQRMAQAVALASAAASSGGSSTGGAAGAAQAAAAAARQTQTLEARVAELNATVEQLTTERRELLARAAEHATLSQLQERFHAERDVQQRRIASLEDALREEARRKFDTDNRLEALQKAGELSLRERQAMQDEVHAVRAQLADSQRRVAVAESTGGGADAQHDLRLQLERLTREYSARVTALDGTVATLRVELATAKAAVAPAREQTDRLQQLLKDNEAMRAQLAQLQGRHLSSSSGGPPYAPGQLSAQTPGSPNGALNTSSGGASAGRGGGGGGIDGRIHAFETTIAALNGELAQVERKIGAVERHYTDEQARLVQQFDRERRQFIEERDECDMLVLKMTNELECLVRENASLKARMRGPYS